MMVSGGKKTMNTLEQSIIGYQKEGWILISRTETTAQLREPKESPSCILVAILLLLGVLPGIIYLLAYNARPDHIDTLMMDANGTTRKI
jgi:hypothetical protein